MQLLTVWTTDQGKQGAVGCLYHLLLSLSKIRTPPPTVPHNHLVLLGP